MPLDPTPNVVRSALAFISPNVDRDEWSKTAMAIKSAFSDSDGLKLFDEWSQGGEHYDAKSVKSTWRSIKADGGIGIGTLFHKAKANGFQLPKDEAAQTGFKQQVHKVADLAEAARSKRRKLDQEREALVHARVAHEAAKEFEAASESGPRSYLDAKGVKPYGVRFSPAGNLLVPLRDGAGKIWNLQRIAPRRPAGGKSDKMYMTGGRKSGLLHWCGDPANAKVLLIAEGYSTSASLHEATTLPVACAFDAGNLLHVAKAVHQANPQALIILCADDDQDTQKRTGKNTGRESAARAARAVQGEVALPLPLPDEGGDFNDLHQAAGLEAVRLVIDAVIAGFHAKAAMPAAQHAEQELPDDADQFVAPSRFVVDGEGLWYLAPDNDNGPGSRRRVCGPLRVVALGRDAQDAGATLLLEFDTAFGKGRRWLMPLTMLAGDGAGYRAALLDQGFACPTDSNRRRWLTEYLHEQSSRVSTLVRLVSKVGWHGRCYVLPGETLGEADGDRLMFHSEAGVEANFNQRGTLERWKNDVARLCIGNSRLTFALSVAFAGPLLAWVPTVSGAGWHYVADTSTGKTTGLIAAASVWGKGAENDPAGYIQKWRATGNGLEYLGEQHNDCTLILDELGQLDPNEAGSVAYMLADGAGKARAKAGGGLRQRPTWRLFYLSSGEVSLAQHIESVGKKMKGGQEVRLIPIPAEVGPGRTLEMLHEFDSGHEFSGWIKQHAAKAYGTAGRSWLEWLVGNTAELAAPLIEAVDRIELQMVPESAGGQVKRGGRRFALVAAAGELATRAGLTGWPEGEATRAATTCFNAWIESRGGIGSSETAAMLRQFVRFMQAHGEGRFVPWERAANEDSHSPRTLHRVGFRRKVKGADPVDDGAPCEYYVLSEAFRSEICAGYDYKVMCRLLIELGAMKSEHGRFDVNVRLPTMGLTRCYHVTQKIFDMDI